jgi:hypothetical protein
MTAKTYRRMSRAEKLGYAMGHVARPMYRCFRCLVQIDERDRPGHLERCWPEVFAQFFMRLG